MAKRVKRDFSREDWETYYRRYQSELARRYLLPEFALWGVDPAGKRVLEVGCGNGGCGAEFARAGSRVVMMDIDERLVRLAIEHNAREGIEAEAFAGSALDANAPFWGRGPFDIVLFRDVMEHLASQAEALRIVRRHLAPGGVVLAVFPPYYSPYGGHQQILPRKKALGVPYNKLPYLQWLPKPVFLLLARGDAAPNREVARLNGIRLTLRKFEREARSAGFVVRAKRLYLSRPSFSLRYGVPVVGAGVLGRIPFVAEAVVTAAHYLLAASAGDLGKQDG